MLSKGSRGDRHEDSLLPDELAIHRDQTKVYFEQVLEHTQLLPQVALTFRVVSVDGNKQAFSKLQAEGLMSASPRGALPVLIPEDSEGRLRSQGTLRGRNFCLMKESKVQDQGEACGQPTELREEEHGPQSYTLTR